MFKFNRASIGSIHSKGQGLASVQRHASRSITADAVNPGSGVPGMPSYSANRFNPVWDRLDQGAVFEDWVPRNNSGINMMYRRIYARDAIAGPSIDIWCNIPWSTFDIVGVEDPTIRKFYEDAFGWWDMDLLGQVSREFLVLGRFAGSLIYDDKRGYWNGLVPHDPDFLEITPIPVRGFDPKLDLLLSPGVRRFLESEDERDARARLTIPNTLIEKFLTRGKAPLDQLSTLYLARKTSPYDYIGTSLLTRVVPFWAIEKALTDAMTVAARRRTGNILHVQAGIDQLWEPTPDEINMISSLFLQADEDPTGAIVVTRNGLQVQEVRQGGQIWKLSDEFEFLTKGKMRALGINEAFLDGQATYNNVEQAKSVFVEQIINFRHTLTHQIFTRKAEILARAHGFRHRSQAQLDHRVYVNTPDDKQASPEELRRRLKLKNLPFEESFRIPRDELILPTVHWHKELKPNQDEKFIDMLEKLEEKLGFKLPLRMWTSSTGISLDDLVAMIPEDQKLRKKLTALTGGAEGGAEGGEESKAPDGTGVAGKGGGDHAELFPEASVKLDALPLWTEDKFLDLRRGEAKACLDKLQQHKEAVRTDSGALQSIVSGFFGTNTDKRDGMNYLLMRIGVGKKLPVSDKGFKAAAQSICGSTMPIPQVAQELSLLGSFASSDKVNSIDPKKYSETWDKSAQKIVESAASRHDECSKQVISQLQSEKSIQASSPSLISGTDPVN